MESYAFKTTADDGKELSCWYITTDAEVLVALIALRDSKIVGYDLETTHAKGFEGDPKAGLDPHRSLVRLIQFGDEAGNVYLIDNFHIGDEGREAIGKFLEAPLPVKVGHNLKFDIKMSRVHLNVRRFGRLFCTELGSRVAACGTMGMRVSLLNACKYSLGIEIDKTQQRSNWSLPELSRSQLAYAAQDAYIVLPLREKILTKCAKYKLLTCLGLEFGALDPICMAEVEGMPFNKERWLRAEAEIKPLRIETAESIWEILEDINPKQALFEFAPTVKLSSAKEMVWILEEFGINLPDMEDPKDTSGKNVGKKTTINWRIRPLAEANEVIKQLLLWRELNKRKTSYGVAYMKHVNPVTQRIHTSYDPLRAATGRYNSSDPNLQQIPHIPIYRRCFEAPQGWKFVTGDYSQIELRLLAEFSGEQGFIDAFNAGIDLHDATTHLMFKLPFPPKKGTPERHAWEETEEAALWNKCRIYAKNINFGIAYGMGARTLAIRTGLTEEEAQAHLDLYHKTYPQLIIYLRNAGNNAVKMSAIRTWSGRLEKFKIDRNNRAEIARAKRKGQNTPIQGSSADMVKLALRLILDAIHDGGLYDKVKILHCVHDEILLLAEDSATEEAKELLARCMVEAGEAIITSVPVTVSPSVSEFWDK